MRVHVCAARPRAVSHQQSGQTSRAMLNDNVRSGKFNGQVGAWGKGSQVEETVGARVLGLFGSHLRGQVADLA